MDKARTAKTSRRTFLNRSIAAAAAVGAAGAIGSGNVFSQAPAAPTSGLQPVANLGGEKIVQVSMVVKDIQKVSKRFSDVFGPSWEFYDLKPKQVVLHGKELPDGNCYLKLALGNCGGRSFKLVQPVSGQSSYMEFLEKQGEGFYSIGLGSLAAHDQIVAALKNVGVGVEMQGDLGNNSRFTILETVDDLGVRVEFASPPNGGVETDIQQTGSFVPDRPGLVNMDRPIFTGGKRFNQVGIVLKDEKKSAKRFEELFGISGWHFGSASNLSDDTYVNEKLVAKADIPSLAVDIASALLGDIQLELLRPIGMKPGGCHQAFFDKHENGIQHLAMGRQTDYDIIVNALKKAGFKTEFGTTNVHPGPGGDSVVSYMAMEDQLGGFVLEITKRKE
jgi:hypothetical protein